MELKHNILSSRCREHWLKWRCISCRYTWNGWLKNSRNTIISCLLLNVFIKNCLSLTFHRMMLHGFCSDLYHYSACDVTELCASPHCWLTDPKCWRTAVRHVYFCWCYQDALAAACCKVRRLTEHLCICGTFQSVPRQREWFAVMLRSLSCLGDGEGFGSWLIDRRKWMKAKQSPTMLQEKDGG